ncbi:TetR/AcrR family transcriptional regulator [Leifsonia sp. L25]|uniref:TetR/AcrR family transcriptional regulator n=1 Tax=Leifsonia sp. L25 TaxID=3423957 RepID=UPI003D69DAA9
MPERLRADARANHDRLLQVAAAAFAAEEPETSLKAIAAEAGVGIGTLYRRFPTREDLIEAVYRSETDRLAGSADRLLAERPPVEALRAWMEAFVDYTDHEAGDVRCPAGDPGVAREDFARTAVTLSARRSPPSSTRPAYPGTSAPESTRAMC